MSKMNLNEEYKSRYNGHEVTLTEYWKNEDDGETWVTYVSNGKEKYDSFKNFCKHFDCEYFE